MDKLSTIKSSTINYSAEFFLPPSDFYPHIYSRVTMNVLTSIPRCTLARLSTPWGLIYYERACQCVHRKELSGNLRLSLVRSDVTVHIIMLTSACQSDTGISPAYKRLQPSDNHCFRNCASNGVVCCSFCKRELCVPLSKLFVTFKIIELQPDWVGKRDNLPLTTSPRDKWYENIHFPERNPIIWISKAWIVILRDFQWEIQLKN